MPGNITPLSGKAAWIAYFQTRGLTQEKATQIANTMDDGNNGVEEGGVTVDLSDGLSSGEATALGLQAEATVDSYIRQGWAADGEAGVETEEQGKAILETDELERAYATIAEYAETYGISYEQAQQIYFQDGVTSFVRQNLNEAKENRSARITENKDSLQIVLDGAVDRSAEVLDWARQRFEIAEGDPVLKNLSDYLTAHQQASSQDILNQLLLYAFASRFFPEIQTGVLGLSTPITRAYTGKFEADSLTAWYKNQQPAAPAASASTTASQAPSQGTTTASTAQGTAGQPAGAGGSGSAGETPAVAVLNPADSLSSPALPTAYNGALGILREIFEERPNLAFRVEVEGVVWNITLKDGQLAATAKIGNSTFHIFDNEVKKLLFTAFESAEAAVVKVLNYVESTIGGANSSVWASGSMTLNLSGMVANYLDNYPGHNYELRVYYGSDGPVHFPAASSSAAAMAEAPEEATPDSVPETLASDSVPQPPQTGMAAVLAGPTGGGAGVAAEADAALTGVGTGPIAEASQEEYGSDAGTVDEMIAWLEQKNIWQKFFKAVGVPAERLEGLITSLRAIGFDKLDFALDVQQMQNLNIGISEEVFLRLAGSDGQLNTDELRSALASASEHYQRAKSLFDEGNYEAALLEYEAANNIIPSSRVTAAIDQCNEQIALQTPAPPTSTDIPVDDDEYTLDQYVAALTDRPEEETPTPVPVDVEASQTGGTVVYSAAFAPPGYQPPVPTPEPLLVDFTPDRIIDIDDGSDIPFPAPAPTPVVATPAPQSTMPAPAPTPAAPVAPPSPPPPVDPLIVDSHYLVAAQQILDIINQGGAINQNTFYNTVIGNNLSQISGEYFTVQKFVDDIRSKILAAIGNISVAESSTGDNPISGFGPFLRNALIALAQAMQTQGTRDDDLAAYDKLVELNSSYQYYSDQCAKAEAKYRANDLPGAIVIYAELAARADCPDFISARHQTLTAQAGAAAQAAESAATALAQAKANAIAKVEEILAFATDDANQEIVGAGVAEALQSVLATINDPNLTSSQVGVIRGRLGLAWEYVQARLEISNPSSTTSGAAQGESLGVILTSNMITNNNAILDLEIPTTGNNNQKQARWNLIVAKILQRVGPFQGRIQLQINPTTGQLRLLLHSNDSSEDTKMALIVPDPDFHPSGAYYKPVEGQPGWFNVEYVNNNPVAQ